MFERFVLISKVFVCKNSKNYFLILFMLLRKVLKHIDLYYILTANNAVVTSQSRGSRP